MDARVAWCSVDGQVFAGALWRRRVEIASKRRQGNEVCGVQDDGSVIFDCGTEFDHGNVMVLGLRNERRVLGDGSILRVSIRLFPCNYADLPELQSWQWLRLTD